MLRLQRRVDALRCVLRRRAGRGGELAFNLLGCVSGIREVID